MSLRPTDTGRTSSDRSDSSIAVVRELGETATRENKVKGGVHPSLRALPDYPAR